MGKIPDPLQSDPNRLKKFRVQIRSDRDENPIGWNIINLIGLLKKKPKTLAHTHHIVTLTHNYANHTTDSQQTQTHKTHANTHPQEPSSIIITPWHWHPMAIANGGHTLFSPTIYLCLSIFSQSPRSAVARPTVRDLLPPNADDLLLKTHPWYAAVATDLLLQGSSLKPDPSCPLCDPSFCPLRDSTFCLWEIFRRDQTWWVDIW